MKMVLYYVELDDFVTATDLCNKVKNRGSVDYQGIIRNYRTDSDKRVALFLVDDGHVLNFKAMFPVSSTLSPRGIPKEIYDFYE